MVRSSHGDDFGSKLPLIRFPKKRITLLNAPQPGRLAARDVEMQLRPTATAAFLAEHTDFLSQRDLRARADGGIDGLKMAVAVIPAAVIQQINHVVAWFHRTVLVTGQNLFPGRNDTPGCGGNHVHHSLRSAAIEA